MGTIVLTYKINHGVILPALQLNVEK